MIPLDIVLSNHAAMQMQRRRIKLADVSLALQFGEHTDGYEQDTREACIELDGRPLTVVYNASELGRSGSYYVITVLRRRCREP